MLYVIIGTDVENSLATRKVARSLHIKRLEKLKQEGRLILAGPNPKLDCETPTEVGFIGSVIIAEFTNLTEAKTWANADPYFEAGVYETVKVLPFIKVLP